MTDSDIRGAVVEEITEFDLDGESGIAVWLTDGRFLFVPSVDDRVCVCMTPKYKAN